MEAVGDDGDVCIHVILSENRCGILEILLRICGLVLRENAGGSDAVFHQPRFHCLCLGDVFAEALSASDDADRLRILVEVVPCCFQPALQHRAWLCAVHMASQYHSSLCSLRDAGDGTNHLH